MASSHHTAQTKLAIKTQFAAQLDRSLALKLARFKFAIDE